MSTLNFFESSKVKIFPCYSRGSFNLTVPLQEEAGTDMSTQVQAVVFDPEARLITETNFASIGGNFLGQYSYIVEAKQDLTRVVINGYYFEIKGFAFSEGQTLWVKLEPIVLAEEIEGADSKRITYSLASLDAQKCPTNLDALDTDSTYYCYAIGWTSGDTDFAATLDSLQQDDRICHYLSYNTAYRTTVDTDGGQQVQQVHLPNTKIKVADLEYLDNSTYRPLGAAIKSLNDGKVAVVEKKDGTAITVDNTDSNNPKIGLDINNSGNVKLSQTDAGLSANIDSSSYELTDTTYTFSDGAEDGTFVVTPEGSAPQTVKIGGKTAAEALEEAKKYADDKDANTAHTHAAGVGTKVNVAGGLDGEVKVDLNVAFDFVRSGETITKVFLYDKNDTEKTEIASFETSAFIKDGMLHDVEYNANTNKLTFTWNTDAGITTNEVYLTDILDPYVFEAGAKLDVAVEDTKVTYSHKAAAAPTVSAGTGRTYITEVVTDGYGHIAEVKTATEVDQDLAHDHDDEYKKLQSPVTDPTVLDSSTSTEFIATIYQDEQGVITVTKKAVDFSNYYTKEEANKADANTTYTVEATVDPLGFTVTSSDGDIQTVALNAPIVSINNLDAELKDKINSFATSDNIGDLADRVTSLESDTVTAGNYLEQIPVATASIPGLMSTADKAIVASISETLKNELNNLEAKLCGETSPLVNRESLKSLETKISEVANNKLDKSDFNNVADSLSEIVSASLSENNTFITNVARKLDGTVYAVAFDTNGGNGYMPPKVVIGISYNLPENTFTPPCHSRFKGWAVRDNESGNETNVLDDEPIELTGNITLVAIWEPDPEKVQHVNAKDSNCTESGNTEYWRCNDCGKCFTDASCIEETTIEAVTTPALGHTWNDATTEVPKTCSVCCATEGEPLSPETPDNP